MNEYLRLLYVDCPTIDVGIQLPIKEHNQINQSLVFRRHWITLPDHIGRLEETHGCLEVKLLHVGNTDVLMNLGNLIGKITMKLTTLYKSLVEHLDCAIILSKTLVEYSHVEITLASLFASNLGCPLEACNCLEEVPFLGIVTAYQEITIWCLHRLLTENSLDILRVHDVEVYTWQASSVRKIGKSWDQTEFFLEKLSCLRCWIISLG